MATPYMTTSTKTTGSTGVSVAVSEGVEVSEAVSLGLSVPQAARVRHIIKIKVSKNIFFIYVSPFYEI